MADNRIYLRCRQCGAGFFLGKYYLGNTYYLDEKLFNLNKLNEFYEEHHWCNNELSYDCNFYEPKFEPKDVNAENQFEIAYEFYRNEDDYLKESDE